MELITNAIERAVTPKQRSKGFAKIIASLLLGLGALVCASAGAQDMEAISQAKAAATGPSSFRVEPNTHNPWS